MGMVNCPPRRPQVDIVPVLFARLEIEAVTANSLAATYCLPVEKVEFALEAAERAGYLRESDGLYQLTRAGRKATMTRGGARVRA